MKTRSTALFQYLKDHGLHEASPDDPAVLGAKIDYRRNYKKEWKRNRVPKKEMRIEFTLAQHAGIRLRAREVKKTPTGYSRQVILSTVESKPMIHNKEQLEKVYQLIGMAVTPLIRYESFLINTDQLKDQLLEAESVLAQYLKQ